VTRSLDGLSLDRIVIARTSGHPDKHEFPPRTLCLSDHRASASESERAACSSEFQYIYFKVSKAGPRPEQHEMSMMDEARRE